MESLLVKHRWDWLKALMAADCWMGAAIIELLGPEQWELLKTEKVFVPMQESFSKAYGGLAWKFGRGKEDLSDVTGEALIRLMSGQFIQGFDPEKGCPRSYMHGAIWQYTRSVLRLKDPNAAALPLDISGLLPQKRHPDPASLLHLKEMIENLGEIYRDAIFREHPELGEPKTPPADNETAEYLRYWRALQMMLEIIQEHDK